MIIQNKIAPPNSLLLLMDKDKGVIPESMNGKLIAATHSCIAIGTFSETDGETLVMLTDESNFVEKFSRLLKIYSGVLETPNKRLDLCTVLLKTVLMIPVSNTESQVDIWANREDEPDHLCVVVIQ